LGPLHDSDIEGNEEKVALKEEFGKVKTEELNTKTFYTMVKL
jgi:hypothetical protein